MLADCGQLGNVIDPNMTPVFYQVGEGLYGPYSLRGGGGMDIFLKSGIFELSMLTYSSAKANNNSEVHYSSQVSKTYLKLLNSWV